MTSTRYQENFSNLHHDAMHDADIRGKKAKTILTVLRDVFGEKLSECRLLDIGCSTGIMSSHFADHVRSVDGIDIDEHGVRFATENHLKPNLAFRLGDAMNLPFAEDSFDIIVCSQIYEHVPDAEKMVAEIFRVLKPGGVCYFGARNRLEIWEPHYRLPFLSIIPRPLAHLYLRAAGRGRYYYEKHLSYWGLKKLTSSFERLDYTRSTVDDPERFCMDYMIRPGSLVHRAAAAVCRVAYWAFPSYIWILRKPETSAR